MFALIWITNSLLVVFIAGVANAGLIGHGVVVVAPVAHEVHGASSNQNYNQISVHPVPVALAHAPIAIGHG